MPSAASIGNWRPIDSIACEEMMRSYPRKTGPQAGPREHRRARPRPPPEFPPATAPDVVKRKQAQQSRREQEQRYIGDDDAYMAKLLRACAASFIPRALSAVSRAATAGRSRTAPACGPGSNTRRCRRTCPCRVRKAGWPNRQKRALGPQRPRRSTIVTIIVTREGRCHQLTALCAAASNARRRNCLRPAVLISKFLHPPMNCQ